MSLLTNLVSYWKLDETSGTRIDSNRANDLTANNAPGSDGKSAKFISANSQYLSHASNASLQMSGNTDFTISCWVKLATLPIGGASYQLVTKDDDAANSRDYTLDITGTGNGLRFYIKGGGTYIVNSGVTPLVNVWYFIVAWYDSSNGQLHLQVDDTTTIYNSSSGATGTDVSAAQFRIGAREYAGAEEYADASIGGVGIWKRLLTDAEKTQLYNGTPSSTPSHPANPIIPLVGSSWYESQVFDFSVLVKASDVSMLHMYASGMAAPVAVGVQSIGLFTANASNPYAWTDQGQILTAGGGWESGGSLRVGSVIQSGGTYYLYYNASDSIGIATSADGVTFNKYASNPILTPTGQGRNDGDAVSQPAVIKEGSSWTMIYCYRNGGTILPGFRYATSSDGFTWTKGGAGDILTTTPNYAEYHQILKIGSTYYLIFESGGSTSVPPFRIYVAESTSVNGSYGNVRKLLSESGTVGSFDRYHVATPFVFSNSVLYYCGAMDHAAPYTTNHWPGGATPITQAQITEYPPSATFPFVRGAGFFPFFNP